MKNSDREETGQGSEAEQVVTDFQSRTLARMEWHFSRLIYLSSLRDYNTGRYHHHGLESRYTSEAVDEGLRRCHTQVFDELGFVDVFRVLNKEPEQYTYWSTRGQAWKKNVGWRIDYQIATPGIAAKARAASIYKNRRFSDHAPLIVDYDYELR